MDINNMLTRRKYAGWQSKKLVEKVKSWARFSQNYNRAAQHGIPAHNTCQPVLSSAQ
jgi:hypothetical protein